MLQPRERGLVPEVRWRVTSAELPRCQVRLTVRLPDSDKTVHYKSVEFLVSRETILGAEMQSLSDWLIDLLEPWLKGK